MFKVFLDMLFVMAGLLLWLFTTASFFCLFKYFGSLGKILLYVAVGVGLVVVLSFFIDISDFKKANTGRKAVFLAGYLFLVAILLVFVWLARCIAFKTPFCDVLINFILS